MDGHAALALGRRVVGEDDEALPHQVQDEELVVIVVGLVIPKSKRESKSKSTSKRQEQEARARARARGMKIGMATEATRSALW